MRTVYDNLNIGGVVAILASTAGVIVDGPIVDTKGYNSAALRVNTGAVGGAANLVAQRVTVAAVLRESADGVTFANANDNTGTVIGTTVAAIITDGNVSSARIEGLNQNRLRYLRVRLTVGAGPIATTAAIFTCAALLELGRAYNNPVTTTVSNT